MYEPLAALRSAALSNEADGSRIFLARVPTAANGKQMLPPSIYSLNTEVVPGIQGLVVSMPTCNRPVKPPATTASQLEMLNSRVRPGLSEAEFKRLFARCSCGLIMTRRVFGNHACLPVAPTVIDLTSDSDDDLASPIVIDLTGESDDDTL